MKNIILVFAIISIFAACKNEKPATETQTETAPETHVELTDAQLKNANLTIGKPETRSLKTVLKVNGTVDVPPHNLVSVSFPLGGFLKKSDLLEGMPVRKGQVLATIEDQVFIQIQHDFLTEQTKLELAESDLVRQTELAKENINAGKLLQKAQSDVRLQQINVRSLSEKLRLIGINPADVTPENITRTVVLPSPISGFVSKVNVNPGKYLAPSDVLFELVNPDDIHGSLTVFEKDLPKINIGQRVKISAPNLPGLVFPAKIILISRTLDEQRAALVHCHFDRDDHRLVPGMFLNADIETTETNALTVPDDAVLRFENRFFVFEAQADGRHFEMIEVKTGASEGGFLQITAIDGADLASKNLVLKNAYSILGKMKNTAE